MKNDRLILGGIEQIAIPGLGLDEVMAKVDTGAFSGAIHATDIKIEHDNDKQLVLSFCPLGRKELQTSTADFKEVTARSASGHESTRYLIPVTLVIKGETYETTIGLSDRTSMSRQMLLGRRFLLEQDAVVDVSLTKDIDNEAVGLEEES